MSAPELRNHRVALDSYGVYAIWVTAESRQAACDVVERLWSENRSDFKWCDGGIEHIEVLDECEEGGAG